jgi:multicomponent Na+:H+ antiporter subunit C
VTRDVVDQFLLYAVASVILFPIGLHGFLFRGNLIMKVLALNVMGSSVFLLLIAVAYRNRVTYADPVPHAMVLTGIVVAVSVTAFALALVRKLAEVTGRPVLPEDQEVP